MKRILILSNLVLLVQLFACQAKKVEKEEGAIFLVTSPVEKDTLIYKEYVCQIQSINHIEIRSQERGYLQKIFVDEGHFVRKGQQMFQIMPLLYQADLEKAKAEMNFVEIEYRNTKSLADSNIVSPN